MTILTANLKHLYQCRAMWFWHVLILTQLVMPFTIVMNGFHARSHRMDTSFFAFYLIASFFLGLSAAMLQKEILAKPFSFCLPGHNEIPRRFIFRVGLIGNFLLGLFFIVYPGLDMLGQILAILAAGSMGMMVYLLCVMTIIPLRQGQAFFGLLYPVIIVFAYLGGVKFIVHAIVDLSAATILAGVLASSLAWRYLGRRELARKLCGTAFIGLFDGWNPAKIRRLRQAQLAKESGAVERTIGGSLERFFLGRMNASEYLSSMRYAWGTIYTTFAPLLTGGKQLLGGLAVVILMTAWMGYTPGMFGAVNFIYIWPMFLAIGMRLPVDSSMVLAWGRKERYIGAVVQVISISAVVTILAGLLAMLTVKMAGILPVIGQIDGKPLVFSAMDIRLCYVPLIVLPIGFTFQTIVRRRGILMMLPMIILATTAIAWINLLRNAPVEMAAGLVAGSWAAFLGGTYWACMRRRITGN